jgi:hypothetical protein
MSADLLRLNDSRFQCDEESSSAAVVGYPDGGGSGCLGDGDFVGLSVGEFDLGEEMQLDGFPIDLWAGAIEANLAEESLGKDNLSYFYLRTGQP